VVGKLTAVENANHIVDELVIVITPRLARRPEQNLAGREFWMPPAK
jgi:hypothetical protein